MDSGPGTRSRASCFTGLTALAQGSSSHPIIFHDRTFGVSELHRREIYLGALNLLPLRFQARGSLSKTRDRLIWL
jgi:hypothetical protein